jgi:hypothetical protein
LIAPLFKELRWSRATPDDVQVARTGNAVTFKSERFVWGVCLDLDGERPLADNFFDLYPDQGHTVLWNEAEDPRILRVGNLA